LFLQPFYILLVPATSVPTPKKLILVEIESCKQEKIKLIEICHVFIVWFLPKTAGNFRRVAIKLVHEGKEQAMALTA
jgi:hypothetical protein